MKNSLLGRLLIASTVLLALLFALLGFGAKQLFVQQTLQAKQEQMRYQSQLLSAAATIDGEEDDIKHAGQLQLPETLGHSRLDAFESGLYGLASNSQHQILARSYSAHALRVDRSLLALDDLQAGDFAFVETGAYYIYRHVVRWELTSDQPELLMFSVLEDKQPTLALIDGFQRRLQRWLLAAGVALISALLLTLRWGLAPLATLSLQLKAIEGGEAEIIEGELPRELQPLANNLNELLTNERQQRARYHSTLADLAHSLKTPLAVIRGEVEAAPADSMPSIDEQSLRMSDIIAHQLQRAVVASPNNLSEAVAVAPCLQKLSAALSKVYRDKGIDFDLQLDDELCFKGDQRDLMEMLGNLVDNACKACSQRVRLSCRRQRSQLLIEIEDDGGGIAPSLRDKILQRGQRADLKQPGQGIGLAVVGDIVDSYQGELQVDDSTLGGALFRLSLPSN